MLKTTLKPQQQGAIVVLWSNRPSHNRDSEQAAQYRKH